MRTYIKTYLPVLLLSATFAPGVCATQEYTPTDAFVCAAHAAPQTYVAQFFDAERVAEDFSVYDLIACLERYSEAFTPLKEKELSPELAHDVWRTIENNDEALPQEMKDQFVSKEHFVAMFNERACMEYLLKHFLTCSPNEVPRTRNLVETLIEFLKTSTQQHCQEFLRHLQDLAQDLKSRGSLAMKVKKHLQPALNKYENVMPPRVYEAQRKLGMWSMWRRLKK